MAMANNANAILMARRLAGAGLNGYRDGPGNEARFFMPRGLAFDQQDALYIADTYNHRIRGLVLGSDGFEARSAAGTGAAAHIDGRYSMAAFNLPSSMVISHNGLIYIADTLNHCIRVMDTNSGEITTLCGDVNEAALFDGYLHEARFNNPTALLLCHRTDSIYVADTGNNAIRQIFLRTQEVLTVAGVTGLAGFADGNSHLPEDEPESELEPESEWEDEEEEDDFEDVADEDERRRLWAAQQRRLRERERERVRRMTERERRIREHEARARERALRRQQQEMALAKFNQPHGLALDAYGFLLVADTGNHAIRRVLPSGEVTTVAGHGGVAGMLNGVGTEALFSSPKAVVVHPETRVIYVADTNNHCIRCIDPRGVVTTYAGGGDAQLDEMPCPAASVRLVFPSALAFNSHGNLFLLDEHRVISIYLEKHRLSQNCTVL